MSNLIIESVFTIFPAIYNKETNIVTFAGQEYTYEEFDTEYLITHIYTLDEYIFVKDLQDLMYIDYLYNEMYIELYKTDLEKALKAMF